MRLLIITIFCVIPLALYGQMETRILGSWQSMYDLFDPAPILTINSDESAEYQYRGESFSGTYELSKDSGVDVILIVWEERVVWLFYVEIVGPVLYFYSSLDDQSPFIFQKID